MTLCLKPLFAKAFAKHDLDGLQVHFLQASTLGKLSRKGITQATVARLTA